MRLKYIENETCFILNYIFFVFNAKNEVDLHAGMCTICTSRGVWVLNFGYTPRESLRSALDDT
jgi:hypothetical protein